MAAERKTKRRGFVMTGGGAKGLYEAGVIHAFHITGMEFDIITGSSIGAMNSVFFAEYLLRKRGLPDEVKADPERAVEAMDRMVRQFHHAWLMLPTVKIIDDGESGPLGKLKNDLLKFNVDLPQLTRLGWWWTDPQRGKVPPASVAVAGMKLLKELVERLGNAGELFRIAKEHRQNPVREALRTYLARFGMDRSLVPNEDDRKLKDVFTAPVTPLKPEHLTGDVAETPPHAESGLVDPNRTMKDYYQAGIDVRLTRANYRTGRLEISSYLSLPDFVRWLERQAWRLQSGDPDQIPLGSFRLQMPGNPNAINAGLASGRFPGVFAPYPIGSIYPSTDADNAALHDMLANWLDGQTIQHALKDAYLEVHQGDEDAQAHWERALESWRTSENMRSFFANHEDSFVDGGAIDNTPSNSIVDAVREWVDREGLSKRDVVLEMFVIFLHPEPKVEQKKAESPTTFEVVGRTLEVQSAAKLASDSLTVETINYFGQQGEDLGQALLALLAGLKASQLAGGGQPSAELEAALRESASQRGLRGFLGSRPEGILDRLEDWGKAKIGRRLPLQVDEITIHPEKMPLDTLQFTERLGYRKQNAIEMLTMGCYNTLWAVRNHLEESKKTLNDDDQRVLKMTKRWMGIDQWPQDDHDRLEALGQSWECNRTTCIFHTKYCQHGDRLGKKARQAT
jgi:hypothetical protein